MPLPSHLLDAKKRIEAQQSKQEPEAQTEAPPVEQAQQPTAQPPAPAETNQQEQDQSDEVVAIDFGDDETKPQSEQTQQPPVQQNAEIEAIKAESAKNKARWETLQGKYRQAEGEIENLKTQLASANGELATARSKTSELEKQIKQLTRKKLSDRISESFSEEERAIHGETIPVIKRLADEIENSRDEEIEAIKKQLEDQQKIAVESATQSQIRSFHESFRARVPDADKIKTDPSWQSFISKRDALSGKPISQIWEEHVQRMNVDGLVKVIEAWRKTKQASTPAMPKTPSLSAAAPQPTFTERGRYKYSEFKQASDAYRQNIRDQALKKSFEKQKSLFDEAKAKGLVDYDS